ncbi:MAG: alpha/beta fold hydrolase [Ktedonobacteraceae bacterium]
MSSRIKITRRKIQVGQQTIYYQVAGEGEPIILIHGLSASSRWWVRNIPALAKHYRVYPLDLPGFGIMRRYRQRFVLDELASGIVAWMDAVGIEQAHLVGHSMGGYICLRMAAQHPERIKSLVLVSPAGVPHVHSVYGYTIPLLVAFRYFKPSFFYILISDALRAGPRTLLHAAQDLLTKDIRDCLPDVAAPTLLIWGEHDSLVPPVFGIILRHKIKDARLLILKKAGHVVMFDQAEQFNAAVLAFLDGKKGG